MNRNDILNALRAVEADDTVVAPLPLTVPRDLPDDIVRGPHITDAFAKPTAVRLLRHDTAAELALVTRRLDTSVLLLVLGNLEKHWLALDAFRLYGDQVDDWAGDPIEAFAEALDRYGLEFDAAGRPARFTPFLRVPFTGDPVASITANLKTGPDTSTRFAQSVRVEGDELLVAWAYFVDVAAHRRDVRQRRTAS